MSLSAFLRQNSLTRENIKTAVSRRFLEDGKPALWELRALTEDEHSRIRDASTKIITVKGRPEQKFERSLYLKRLCAAAVVYPDLKNAELQKSYGVTGGEDLIGVMLLPGEFNDLLEAVQEQNGFDSESAEEDRKEIKNS